jgi:hypothetical protein
VKKTPDNPILTVVKSAQPVNNTGEADKWADRRIGDYCISHSCIFFMRKGRDNKEGKINEIPTPLTHNFVALIAEQINLDDGLKQEAAFLVEGRQKNGQPLPTLTIPATQYQAMQWPLRNYGGRGIVEADQATPRRLANGILILSGDIPITTVYQHTGWRHINDQWFYLSGSGAIGAEGLNVDTRVELGEGHMQRYVFPEPAVSPGQMAATLFSLLYIAPENKAVGVSLFCGVVRSLLGECLPVDFALFLAGQSGSQKSECAALALACFGDFNARRFPANFTDTESDLEHKAHQAKDAVFVVDDLAPGSSQQEANKMNTKCDRLFRGAGNQSGRGRRNADMTGKAAYFPRCMIVATGEDTPKGASLLSRMLVIEFKRGDVALSSLTSLQHLSQKGELSAIIAAFIKWLAPRIPDLKKTFPNMVHSIRDKALAENFATSHPRAADIYASLYAAADIYLEFCHEVGAINSIRATELMDTIDDALKDAIRAQGQFQKQSDEVERFIALLRGCFSAGECHVSDSMNQGPPVQHPFIWGWRTPSEGADVAGRGQLIGCVNQINGELWLDPEATFKTVQKFASSQNDPILIQKATLWKRLLERGLLTTYEVSKKTGVKRPDVKRSVTGKRVRVLIFNTNVIENVDLIINKDIKSEHSGDD